MPDGRLYMRANGWRRAHNNGELGVGDAIELRYTWCAVYHFLYGSRTGGISRCTKPFGVP